MASVQSIVDLDLIYFIDLGPDPTPMDVIGPGPQSVLDSTPIDRCYRDCWLQDLNLMPQD